MATVQDYLQNANWVRRCGEAFHQLDTNKNGYLSREDWLTKIDKLAKVVPDRPDQLAKLREVWSEYLDVMRVTRGVKVDKQEFIQLSAAMAEGEMVRVNRGEVSMTEKRNNAVFDVLDKNHDGQVTWEEYKLLTEIFDFGEDTAKATFALLDKNKSGKIDRKEFTASQIKFSFTLDDPDTKGMFGSKYE